MLNLGIRQRCVVNSVPLSLYARVRGPVIHWVPQPVWTFGRQQKPLTSAEDRTAICSARSLDTISARLS